MHFAHPEILNGLWLLIPFGLLGWGLLRRKRKRIEKFAEPQLVQNLMQNFSYPKYYFKFSSLILAMAFSLIALARPQWGYEWQEIKRQGIDILVAIDTSKSMLTADVRPNRLERTKLAVKDLVKKLQGDRIGLIAFAGDAFLICPLTVDYNGFLLTLEDLNTDTIPRGGTALGEAMEEAIKTYAHVPSQHKALIIVTDGENLEGEPLKTAEEAKKHGVKVFCVGIGTQEGELVQLENQYGEKEFLKDEQGNFIKSRLNEDLLQKIAMTTDGAYVRASGAQFGLDLIYDRELSKMERRDFESKKEKRYFERFQIPLAMAFLFLVLDGLLNPRTKLSTLLWLMILFFGTGDVWAAPVSKAVREGNRAYTERDYGEAYKKYEGALDQQPNSDIINFNLGTALYRLKKYPEALEHLQRSLLSEDEQLKAKTYFNLANTYYRMGMQHEDTDYDEAIRQVEKAVEQVNKSLAINKEDKEAQRNKEFFEAELRRLKRDRESYGNRQKEAQKQKKEKEKQEKEKQAQADKEKQQQGDGSQEQNSSGGNKKEEQEKPSHPEVPNESSTQGQGQEEKSDDVPYKKATTGQLNQLSEEEARQILEQYQNSEEPDGLLNLNPRPPEEQPVLKDW